MAFISRLNPPQINGKLPAFYGNELIIPFTLNRVVGFNQFDSMVAIIKTVSTNTQKAFLLTGVDKNGEWGRIWYDSSTRNYRVSFIIQTEDSEKTNYFVPQIGQYYKVQLACVDKLSGTIGYYSSVGVIKYSAEPTLFIQNLDAKKSNKNTYEYVGVYSQENDINEKIYSYEFNLYDESNGIIATSGMNIHNNSTDIDLDSSSDTWRVTKNLITNKPYYIQYKGITINGLGEMVPCESPKYKIMELDISLPDISADLSAKLNKDEGYIQISLIGKKNPNDTKLRSGSFVLLRSSSENNYDTWEQLTEFQLSLYDPHTNKDLYRDYVIEQGVNYIYAIQAYNQQGFMSGRLKNYEGEIHCDFEDAFLYDGERQLKIRFNPSITSFKSTVLENKVDTIGSKYPFIFRNGIVNYKEFSISGLLSLLGDENEQFLSGLINSDSSLRITSPGLSKDIASVEPLYLLTGNNYYKERQFKLEALKWLSNGKPKLFKSPAEGNYIVRLMGVSLSPEETLGRMLHIFNCSACEIAEYNFSNLDKYNLIPGYTKSDLKYYTINLNNIEDQFKHPDNINSIVLPQTYEAKIIGAPYTKFSYELTNDKVVYEATIGSNGIFEFPVDILENYPLISITLKDASWGVNATLLIGYRDPRIKTFSYIYDVSAIDNKIQLPLEYDNTGYEEMTEVQIILPPFYDGIVEPIPPQEDEEIIPPEDEGGEEEVPPEEEAPNPNRKYWVIDILKFLEDLRKKTGMFHYIKVSLRDMYTLYENNGIISFIRDQITYEFNGENYSIFDPNEIYLTTDNHYYDGFDLYYKKEWIKKPVKELTNKFVLNNTIFSMGNYKSKTFKDLPSLVNFRIGSGLKVDVVYQEKDIFYQVEQQAFEDAMKAITEGKEPPYLYTVRKNWENALNDGNTTKEEIKILYREYLTALENTLANLETKVGVNDVIYAI